MAVSATLAHTPDPKTPPAPRRTRGGLTPYLLLLPGMVWLTVFFLVPLATLAGTSLQKEIPGSEPRSFTPALQFSNYITALFGDQAQGIDPVTAQLSRSFLYGGIATVLALLIGYPLAYMIAFKAGRWRNILLVLVVAPFFTSFLLRTLAWRQILGEEGLVVPTMKALHLVPEGMALTASPLAVVAGITYNFLPFMVLPLYASIERIDPRLLEAGADLYGNAFAVLRKVTLPLSMPGIVAGTLLTFIPAAGDYVNAALLGNRNTTMLGNVIQSRFQRTIDYPNAAALSFILLAAIVALVMLYVRRAGTEELV